MFIRLGIAFLLLLISSTASADKVTYHVDTRSYTGEYLQGVAFADSDQWEVDGFVILEPNSRTSFVGSWTRMGTIEAIDSNGDMYMFHVIGVLNDTDAINLTDNF